MNNNNHYHDLEKKYTDNGDCAHNKLGITMTIYYLNILQYFQ